MSEASPAQHSHTSSSTGILDTEKSPDPEKLERDDPRHVANNVEGTKSEQVPSSEDESDHNGPPLSRVRTNPPMPLVREVLFVAVCCCGQLFTQAGLALSIPISSIIGESSFGSPSPGQLSWFAAAYSLTVGTFIVAAGRAGDILGHKTVYIFGWAWYALWSLIAGLAAFTHSQIFFDFCRAMQGIGPAVLLPCSLALLGRTYPPGRRKEMVFALFGATAPNGFLVGGVFAALLAQRVWWPWAYWIMCIACVLLGGLSWMVIPGLGEEDEGSSVGPQSFDWLGCVTGVAGLVLFNVAWNQAPVVGWGNPQVIVTLVMGVLFFVAFVFVEKRVKQPLVPLDGFTGQTGLVLGCVGLGWSSFGIWLIYYYQFLENLRGHSPLVVIAQSTPVGVSGLLAALTTGFLLSRIQPGVIMMVAMMCFCAGNVLLATMPIDQTYWLQAFLSQVITPWGMDMSFPCATLILSNFVPKRHQGIAASLVATIVNYSISIGLGIGGTVDSQVNEGGENLLMGYRGAWYAGIGLSGMGILLSIYFVIYGLRQKRSGQ